jgi:PAS domain S-box-containing protein
MPIQSALAPTYVSLAPARLETPGSEWVFHHAPVALAGLDWRGTLRSPNPAMCALLGAACEGSYLDRRIVERDLATAMRAALIAGRGWTQDCRVYLPDGETRWCAVSISPCYDHHEHSAILAIHDITARREHLATLEATNATLRRTNEARSSFVSIVSHELRTPLTAIRGAVEVVAAGHAGEVSADQQHFLDMALRNLDRLAAILDDLLDLSKIDAGTLRLTCAETTPESLVREVVATFRERASSSGITLGAEIDAGLPPLWADSNRLLQVFGNLVGNALKFTPAGGSVAVKAERRGASHVCISVTDTGIGIDAAHQERIFERFWQADDVLGRKRGGAGLGLAIARDIVEAHAGRIELRSQAGEGSTFTVLLPVDQPTTRELAILEDHLPPHRRYPNFGILLLEARTDGQAVTLAEVATQARALLPRACDEVIPMPASGFIAVILGGTDAAGAHVVRRRLSQQLGDVAQLHGPSVFPEDGSTAGRLVAAASSQPSVVETKATSATDRSSGATQ